MNKFNAIYIHLNLIFVAFSFNSCNYYTLNNEAVIYCKYPISQGFLLAKISEVKYSKDGVPIKCEFDTIIDCCTKGDVLTDQEVKLFKEKGLPVKQTGIKFEPQRRISFKSKNEFYDWYFAKPYNIDTIYDICPISFMPGSTYLIYKLLYKGNPGYGILINVNSDGTFKTVHFITRGIFPDQPYDKIK